VARKSLDCRTIPGERNCTVQISGEEDEVLELAVAHAVAAHGHTDGAGLREELRAGLRDEEGLLAEPGSFLQLVEFHARDLDGFGRIVEDWRERMGREATVRWGVVAADRHRADTYVEIVAFPDHASAMRNSDHPVTADFAKRMQEVTEGEASYRDLDVVRVLRP
jgi:predicted small metal-binding protein